jgi:hypothetical protein
MAEEDIIRWLIYERDLKRETALLNSKHKTLRNTLDIIKALGYQQHRNATNVKERERTRINNMRSELLQEGITEEDMRKYETPNLLPPEKKPLAYGVLYRRT